MNQSTNQKPMKSIHQVLTDPDELRAFASWLGISTETQDADNPNTEDEDEG